MENRVFEFLGDTERNLWLEMIQNFHLKTVISIETNFCFVLFDFFFSLSPPEKKKVSNNS